MITNAPLPPEIENAISGERVDFILKSSRLKAVKQTNHFFIFSFGWLGLAAITAAALFIPLLLTGSVDITFNNEPITITYDNLEVLFLPTLIIGIFAVGGLAVLGYGLYGSFAKGGWYIGMTEGLSWYRKGKTELKKWNEFKSGAKASGNDQKGDVTLNLQSGGMFFIAGIPNAKKIAEICNQRIKAEEPSRT